MGRTLLLADDSVTIQKVVGISFANEDVQLVTVDNGDDAVIRARELRPDVILADVVMPGKTGYEVCEAIHQDPELSHIPVLLLTGTFEAFDEERAQECGAVGHVSKPFEAQTLVDRVLELLERPPAPAPAVVAAADTPVPIARIEPAPAPAPELIDAAGESFDFFDEDLGDLSPIGEAASGDEPLEVDEDTGGFAFGSEAEPEPPPQPERPADHTVAMLPDELDVEPPDALAELDLAPPEPAESATPEPAPRDDDSFDFAIGEPIEEVGPVAPGTVLDPKGASGFDVSTSDLAAEATPEPEPVAGPEPPAAPEAPVPAPPPAALEEPASLETVAQIESDPFGFDLPPAIEPEALEPLAEAAPPAPELEPAPAEIVDESALEDLPPLDDEPPAAEPRVAATHDPAALAGVALAEIEPALREKIHDTLEKVAWESLGDVAEQIVRLAIERVEQVAWEVVPQMAETLIREEIRRMKGEQE